MRRREGSSKTVIFIVIVLVILGFLVYLYNSKMFERNAPVINLSEKIYWNLREPLKIEVSDDSGIKFARVTLSDGENQITLLNEKFTTYDKNKTFDITFPKTGFFSKKNEYILTFEVTDSSRASFFSGNSVTKSSTIVVDIKRPDVYVVANSYKISRGGAGTVIFKAEDANMAELSIQTSSGKTFKAAPFYKDGYFVSIIAWPINDENFSAYIVAKDLAGNEAKERIRYYLDPKTYKKSEIELRDSFLDGGIKDLAEELAFVATKDLSNLDKFKYLNENIRAVSEQNLLNATSAINNNNVFKVQAFYPLRNGAAVASYGDYRIYSYQNNEVSRSYHLGLDLASTREADIVLSNSGRVAFAGENGIYGNTVIVDHGLGVYSLYAHCSRILVNVGDEVLIGDVIAKSGSTGFAFGDHLHFGIVVQGVEVRPTEWMDNKWLKENIYDLISSATKAIEKR
ncbi:MAG: M23 family metallopeptidase [Campylobacteraceae bacterium]